MKTRFSFLLAVLVSVFVMLPGLSEQSLEINFSKPQNISTSAGGSLGPAIAISESGPEPILVVWADNSTEDNQPGGNFEIRFKRCALNSKEGKGLECLSPKDFVGDWIGDNISNTPEGVSREPDIAVDSGPRALVVWRDDTPVVWRDKVPIIPGVGRPAIFLKRSDKDFKFPEGAFNISSPDLENPSPPAYKPAIAVDKYGLRLDQTGKTYVVWQSGTRVDPNIHFRSFIPFSPLLNISTISMMTSQPIRESQNPAMAIVDKAGQLSVVWQAMEQNSSRPDIFIGSSENPGVEFEFPEFDLPFNITTNSGDSIQPALAADLLGFAGLPLFYMVWADDTLRLRDDPPGNLNYEIFLRRSIDTVRPFKNISRSPDKESREPAIAVDSAGTIYVVWQEMWLERSEIFFSFSTDKGKSFSEPQNISAPEDIPRCLEGGKARSPAVAIGRGEVVMVWVEEAPGETQICAVRKL